MNQKIVEQHLEALLSDGLGFNLLDPNLSETPKRIAKMYCEEFFCNVGKEFEDFKAFPNDEDYSQIIMMNHINFTSMCSHHFLPFTGLAWVLYIPEDKLIGASKAARLVSWYAKRPQLQENLVHQIANRFMEVIKPKGVMILMQAVHQCMACRGVRQYAGAGMGTSVIRGCFKEEAIRNEALNMISISMKIKA